MSKEYHEMHVADALDNLFTVMGQCELIEHYDAFTRDQTGSDAFLLIGHYPDAVEDACGVAGLSLTQVVDMVERLAAFVEALQDFEPDQDKEAEDNGQGPMPMSIC